LSLAMKSTVFWDVTPCSLAAFYRFLQEDIASVLKVNKYIKQAARECYTVGGVPQVQFWSHTHARAHAHTHTHTHTDQDRDRDSSLIRC
jgi:Co/Zn/Cd efflux system component